MRSPRESCNLSIVIPAFNEEANISPIVEEAILCLRATPQITTEFILVNDGSADGTLRGMESIARSFPGVVVISHETNKGLGAAIYSGMAAATGEWLTWLPADGQIPPENVDRLLRAVDNNSIGILLRPEQQRSFGRRFLTLCFNIVVTATMSNRYYRYSGVFLVPRNRVASLKLVASTAVQNLAVVEHCAFRGAEVVAVEGTLRARASGLSKVANPKTTLKTLLETITVKRKIEAPERHTKDATSERTPE